MGHGHGLLVGVVLGAVFGACGGETRVVSGSGSPLGELMGWTNDPVEQRRQMLEIEEVVASCMRSEGFEYVPFDLVGQVPENTDGEPGTRSYGEKFGYGVMRGYEVGDPNSGGGVPFDVSDPNAAYVASLSGREQATYYAVLYGYSDTSTDDTDSAQGRETLGCRGRAERAASDPNQVEDVVEMVADYRASRTADPERQELLREWATCLEPKLAELGLDGQLTAFNDAHQLVDTALNEAIGNTVVAVDRLDEGNTTDDVLYGISDDTGSGWIVLRGNRPRELTGHQIDQLTELELAVWRADWACLDDVGYHGYIHRSEQQLVDQILSNHPELAG